MEILNRPIKGGHTRLWHVAVGLVWVIASTGLSVTEPIKTGRDGTSHSVATERIQIAQRALELSSSVPAELGAAARLQIAEQHISPAVSSSEDLIQTAFDLARESPLPFKMAFIAGNVDSREGTLGFAFTEKLDGLSLRSRAVVDMLPVSQAKARQLFDEIGPLHIDDIGCSSSLVPDPSAYFEAALAVFRMGFVEAEREKKLDQDFIETVLGSVSHASEVAPAIHLLLAISNPSDPPSRGEIALASALTRIRGDSRAYAATERESVVVLMAMVRKAPRVHRALLEGIRTYVSSNHQQVCNDYGAGIGGQGQVEGDQKTSLIASLNEFMAKAQVKELAPSDLVPQSFESDHVKLHEYWLTPSGKELLATAQSLNEMRREGHSSTPEWQNYVEEFLQRIAHWKSDAGESPEDVYIEKAILYSDLFDSTPFESPIQSEVENQFFAFLGDPPTADFVQVFWIWELHSLVKRIQGDHPDGGALLSKLLSHAGSSPNPAVALYGCLMLLQRNNVAKSSAARNVNMPAKRFCVQ